MKNFLVWLEYGVRARVLHVDWVNSVIVAVVLTGTFGLYAGLIGSRMFAFCVVRTKTVSWVLRLKTEVFARDYESPLALAFAFTDASHEIMAEARGLGHEKLMAVLQDILCFHFAVWARQVQVPYTLHEIPALPDKALMEAPFAARGPVEFAYLVQGAVGPQAIAEIVWRALWADACDAYAANVSSHVAQIASCGPNWFAFLNPRFFPNYLSADDNIIGLMTRRSWRARIADVSKRAWARCVKWTA
jgi:hypothetical protein